MFAWNLNDAETKAQNEEFIEYMIKSLDNEECFKELVARIKNEEAYKDVFKDSLVQICTLIHLYDIEYLKVDTKKSLLCEYITKIVTIPVEKESTDNYKELLDKLNDSEILNQMFLESILLPGISSFQNDLFNSIVEKMNISDEDINNEEKFKELTSKVANDITSKAPMFKSKVLTDIVKDKEIGLLFLEFAKYINKTYCNTFRSFDIDKYGKLLVSARIKALFGGIEKFPEDEEEKHI